jgi:hypothetical protein
MDKPRQYSRSSDLEKWYLGAEEDRDTHYSVTVSLGKQWCDCGTRLKFIFRKTCFPVTRKQNKKESETSKTHGRARSFTIKTASSSLLLDRVFTCHLSIESTLYEDSEAKGASLRDQAPP